MKKKKSIKHQSPIKSQQKINQKLAFGFVEILFEKNKGLKINLF